MFIYTLPILFSHLQFGSPLEIVFVFVFLYAVLFISSASSSVNNQQECIPLSGLTMYEYLLCAWTGQLKLWHVFWPFYIILIISLFLFDTLAIQGNFTVSSWDEVHFIFITPVIFWTIAVWRNSYHTKSRFWIAGARLITLSVIFEYVLKLIIRIEYPRVFFACKEIMLDYAGCF